MGVDGSKMGYKSFNFPSLFLTCSIAKNRKAKGYSPNALPESPEKSCAVIENENQDTHAKATTF